MTRISLKLIQKLFRPRKAGSHKGDHGHALLVAGSKGRTGAAVIAAKACLRAGCGLLTVNIPQEERMILQVAIPEAMLSMREEDQDHKLFSAAGVGPAMGTGKDAAAFLKNIISGYTMPLVLDADALTLLSTHTKLFEQIPAGTILTPHPKEFDRLFGVHEDDRARRKTATGVAEEANIIIVLKGQHSFITNGKHAYLNTTGNSGLAKGGSGDALTGIITSFLAQGYIPLNAAVLGVYLHGLVADIALKDQSHESMLITDVIGCMGKAFKKISIKK